MNTVPHQRILVVDDEEAIRELVGSYLRTEGFDVAEAVDGEDALSQIAQRAPELVVLDLRLPGISGLDVLREIRRTSAMYVIVLTARADETDKLIGLELGADDYIKKPFSQRLLIERIRAVLRRRDAGQSQPGNTNEEPIRRGPMVLDPIRHSCTWRDHPVTLTVTEFLLVQTLARHPGHVKSRDQLIDAAYGENIYVDDRTIDSHIKRLRKKFKHFDPEFSQIETLYGVGYRFRQD